MMRNRAPGERLGRFSISPAWREIEKHSFKEKTKEWVRNLPRNERLELFYLEDQPWLVNALLKMYWKKADNSNFGFALTEVYAEKTLTPEKICLPLEDNFLIKTDVKHKKRSPESLNAEKAIVEGTVLCSRVLPLDSMSLGVSLVEHPDTFFELMDTLSDKKFLTFNMLSLKTVAEGEYFFSSWFDPRTLNWLGQWIAAIFERQMVLGMINHIQDHKPISTGLNPLLKQRALRKIWKKLDTGAQEDRISNTTQLYNQYRANDKNRLVQLTLQYTENLLVTFRILGKHELEKSTEIALRYKRRKEPSLFLDFICYPTFEQAGLPVRLRLWYLATQLQNELETPDVSTSPSPAPAKSETKKKKKKSKPKRKGSTGKMKDPTENQNSEVNSQEVIQEKQKADARWYESELERIRQEAFEEDSDGGSWMVAGEKRLESSPTPTFGKKTTKSSRKKPKRAKSKQSIVSASMSDKHSWGLKTRTQAPLDSLSTKGTSQRGSQGTNSRGGTLRSSRPALKFAEKTETMTVNLFREEKASTTSLETESVAGSFDDRQSFAPTSPSHILNNASFEKVHDSKLKNLLTARISSHLSVGDSGSGITPETASPEKLKALSTDDWLTNDLNHLLQEINLHSTRVKPLFQRAQQRISRVLLGTLKGHSNIKLDVYGSMATGLQIPGSDMDLCVTGFMGLTRVEAAGVLQTIADNLALFAWCTEVKPILTATIPVVKLVIDPYIPFEQLRPGARLGEGFKPEPGNLEKPGELPEQNYPVSLNIDLTVDSVDAFGFSENGGLRTTEFVKSSLSNYSNMRDLTHIFKWMLAHWGAHRSYTGREGLIRWDLIIRS